VPKSAMAILEAYEKRVNQRKAHASCAECNRPLQEAVTGCRSAAGIYVCSDCYYQSVGELIEQRAITSGRALRG
jgi:ribosomal protein L37AE/L43A